MSMHATPSSSHAQQPYTPPSTRTRRKRVHNPARGAAAKVPLALDEEASQDARRFEDFTTIDWVRDTLLERSRRQTEQEERARELAGDYDQPESGYGRPPSRRLGRRRRARNAIMRLAKRAGVEERTEKMLRAGERIADAGQSWFVVSLVGACIGLQAAISSIITVWLSDLKLGYCSQGWWLNKKFCCWEMVEEGAASCEDWHDWTRFAAIQWFCYVVLAGWLSWVCAFVVKSYAPYAAGSGISEIKCILAGFVIKGYLSLPVLVIKAITLPIAIASGLSVGKEGPSVHVASAVGHVIASNFKRFARSQAKMREIVTAASAAGVAVAFGSPIGGVLFSLEEMTINFPIKTMWRSFFCALVATVVLSAMNPFRTGKLVLFQVHFDRDWHFFEVGFFILIGIFGGLYGAFVIKYNLQVQTFRRKHLAAHGISEVVFLAVLTAAVGYLNMFIRIDMNESLDILFRECEGGDYENLCQTWAQWRMVNSLLLATVLRTCLVVVSYGCKVPAGIFVPSMAVGATFGRMVGILVKALYRAHPTWSMFAACDPEKPCITPGTYAFLGAAAGLAGITRITVTVVVIMFELTGALTYILPTMIVVMVTKAVSDQFGKGGIADQMIKFNGYPLLENEDHAFNVSVSTVMKRDVASLPAQGLALHELEALLSRTQVRGFPIVQGRGNATLLGDISRTDLEVAIEKAHATMVAPDARCVFTNEPATLPRHLNGTVPQPLSHSRRFDSSHSLADTASDAGASDQLVDFSEYVNQTPLTVSPKQPLEMVMSIFKKMGPRVILIEQYGILLGIISLKDCLKYTIAHESLLHGQSRLGEQKAEEDMEVTIEEVLGWIKEALEGLFKSFLGVAKPAPREPGTSFSSDVEDEEEWAMEQQLAEDDDEDSEASDKDSLKDKSNWASGSR